MLRLGILAIPSVGKQHRCDRKLQRTSNPKCSTRSERPPLRGLDRLSPNGFYSEDRIPYQPANTAAIATAVASTFPEFSPATHMRPERTRYTACSSRNWSTCSADKPV